MLEIQTPTGWTRIQLQAEAKDCFDGVPVHVDADVCAKGFQALLNANNSTTIFKADGRIERCSVAFDDSPILEVDKIAYCVLRLTPVA